MAENTRGPGTRAPRALLALTLSLGAVYAHAGGPSGGQVSAGTGSIAQSGAITTITQESPKLSLTWANFNIAPQETVDFVQPSANAIAVNRIYDTHGTQILGHLNANGQVFLINPNGILFGPGAQVNVAGLVGTTLDVNDLGPDAGAKFFSGNSNASVVDEGTINAAPGGYVLLLGSHVSNQGVIIAPFGTVALAAGSAATVTFSDNSLVHLQVDQSVWRSLVENGGLIEAAGGRVVMTAGAKGALLASLVNNTGVIEARTVENHDGSITLLGGTMASTVIVGGTLDASGPNGGDGGFIETSAAHVEVAADARVTTVAVTGRYGSWVIDPQDFVIAASGGDMTGAALSSELGTTPVVVESSAGLTAGSGNVNVNDTLAWSANTALTLTASNNININANITATGNTAGLVINPNTTNGTATASGTGIYILRSGVSITLPGTAPSLSIAGMAYTVINTLGMAGSITGTDLQGLNALPSGNYALGSNIDATATAGWNNGAGFTPIGTVGIPFSGIFDGLGHTISNLTISLATPNVGLFGATGGTGATIRNVGLVGGSVTGGAGTGGLVGNNGAGVPISGSYSTGSVTGGAGTGGLVGTNTTGTISDSYSTGSVNGAAGTGGLVGSNTSGAIRASFATGSVNGAAGAGGLIGTSTTGTISDSYSTGSVSGAAGTGGLIGSNTSGAISTSYATGSVNGAAGTGGLIGSTTSGPISNSYAAGNVNGGTGAGVGGLIGSNTSGLVTNTYAVGGVSGTGASVGALLGSSNTGVVTDSYWDKTTSLVQGSAGGGIGMTTAQMMMQANFVSATTANSPDNPAWDFTNTWVMYEGLTFPLLSGFMTPLTVTANNANRTYGQANPAFGVSYSVTPSSNLLGTVSYGGTAQTATDVGAYTIVPGGLYSNQGGYVISYATGTLTVTPASLTVAGQSAANKVYDGTLSAVLTGGTLSGVIAGDAGTLTLTQAGSFVSKNVGAGIGVTASDSVSGASAGNYTLSEPLNLAANITPASLTVAGQSAANKVYDGTLSAVLTGGTLSGVIAGDAGTLTLTQAGSFVWKNVGAGIGVTGSDSVSGASAGNYTLSEPLNLAANITPASLTVAGQSASNKVYDGTLSAVLTGGALSGVIAGDAGTLTLTQAGSFVSKNVGAGIGVTASDSVSGASAGNYTLSEPLNLVANITPATLTYTAAAASFTAGQTPSGLSGTLSGFVLADNQANATVGSSIWTSNAAASSQPGHYAIDGSGLTAANYVFVEAPGDATALTLQSGSSAVLPPVISPVIPPVIPPVISPVISPVTAPVTAPVIAPVIASLSGPDAATLGRAQTAAGTLEADLLPSQTNIQSALPLFTRDVVLAQSGDSDQQRICSHVSSKSIFIDEITGVPPLRIVCGGVKLPDHVVDINAR